MPAFVKKLLMFIGLWSVAFNIHKFVWGYRFGYNFAKNHNRLPSDIELLTAWNNR